MVVGDRGWVDYDFGHLIQSTASQILPRQMRVCRIGWVNGQDGGTSHIKVNPTHVPDHHSHPVIWDDIKLFKINLCDAFKGAKKLFANMHGKIAIFQKLFNQFGVQTKV